MNCNRTDCSCAALALGFVCGGLLGAARGIVSAPETGWRTREKIKERSKEAGERLR